MTQNTKFKSRSFFGLVNGAIIGFVVGAVFTLESWIFASVIKLLLAWDTGIWPDWFPGHIPDFVLSGWWAIIVIVICTLTGATIGLLRVRRLDLF